MAPGTISATYVTAVAVAARGAWPSALLDEYPADAAHLAHYALAARSDETFAAYLAHHVAPGHVAAGHVAAAPARAAE